MKFIAHPFILYGKFFFERFDKTLADVAERSDEVRKNPYIHILGCLHKWSRNWNAVYKTL